MEFIVAKRQRGVQQKILIRLWALCYVEPQSFNQNFMNPELRTPMIVGNWKLGPGEFDDATDLANSVDANSSNYGSDSEDPSERREIIVCPPHIYLNRVFDQCAFVEVGAQDLSAYEGGAHTGDSPSGAMLNDMGLKYVIVGHSEKREAGETDETVAKKVRLALRNALSPILCVGERLDARETGRANEVVTGQLTKDLEGVTAEDVPRIVIAYEPGAIGTGKTATPGDAGAMCSHIRGEIVRLYSQDVADKLRIQYGGSVNSKNAAELMAQPDVDGLLVGGASLKADEFEKIVKFNVPAVA